MGRTEIILKEGKEKSVKRMHPWIFSGAIKNHSGELVEGEVVTVFSASGEFLAAGHYQPGTIAIRILSFHPDETFEDDFWFSKIKSAYDYRVATGLALEKSTNVYRLIHGEGDGLPGLIIDYYNGTCIIQCHTVGMFKSMDKIIASLKKLYGSRLVSIYNKSENTLPFKALIPDKNALLEGNEGEVLVKENDLNFKINFLTGQKTGFFIDQRENRELLRTYSENRNVLNMFCYTGSFSVYALSGNASMVHSVDSSKTAIELTKVNVELNYGNCARHQAFESDAFRFLEQADDMYDLIVLDPPAFAKHASALKNALQGYKRLNAKAIEKIKKGGILFTFSCSQVVSREEFRKSVFAASTQTGRSIRIMHQLTQPADHPISIFHPEGEYLKGLVLYIE